MTPPITDVIVVKRPKKSHLYFLVIAIGIKNRSGGIGKNIDSIVDIMPKNLREFLFADNFNTRFNILKAIVFINFIILLLN